MKQYSVENNLVPVLSPEERVDALEYVLNIIEIYKEYELPSDIEITDVHLMGSRINGGCKEGSDLDVYVGYKNIGDAYWKECHIFNILNAEERYYRGIEIDFFPVLED